MITCSRCDDHWAASTLQLGEGLVAALCPACQVAWWDHYRGTTAWQQTLEAAAIVDHLRARALAREVPSPREYRDAFAARDAAAGATALVGLEFLRSHADGEAQAEGPIP